MTTWAIVPVKPLRDGKSRLAHILSADERAQLTTYMLQRTLDILNSMSSIYRTLVISRDPAVLKLARQRNAFTFGEGEKLGLNMALTRAAHIVAAQKAAGVLILPADLPLITTGDIDVMLAGVSPLRSSPQVNGTNGRMMERAVAICPDRTNDGTNALYISPPLGFTFHYGAQSFQNHLDEAERLGIQGRIVHAPGLKFDLDTEEDWHKFLALNGNRDVFAAQVAHKV